jgi:hypothetical protein
LHAAESISHQDGERLGGNMETPAPQKTTSRSIARTEQELPQTGS